MDSRIVLTYYLSLSFAALRDSVDMSVPGTSLYGSDLTMIIALKYERVLNCHDRVATEIMPVISTGY